MKTNSIIALILSISLFGLFGCADKYEVDYEAPVKIEFAGVDQNNRISLTKGIAEYTATVKVQGEIMSFEIYQADSKTVDNQYDAKRQFSREIFFIHDNPLFLFLSSLVSCNICNISIKFY